MRGKERKKEAAFVIRDDEAMDAKIGAYLDGGLSAEERAQFERMMGADESLRAEVELQRKAEECLRRRFAVPAAGRAPEQQSGRTAVGEIAGRIGERGAEVAGQEKRAAHSAQRRWIKWGAVAAVLTLGLVGAWVFGLESRVERVLGAGGARERGETASTLYARLAKPDFEPAWVCDTDEKFLAYTKERLGTGFLVRPEKGVTLVGWAYADGAGKGLGPYAAALMAKVSAVEGEDPEWVMVVVDEAKYEGEMKVSASSGLNVFKRKVGDLVMYEVTPLAESRVVDRAYLPRKGHKGVNGAF